MSDLDIELEKVASRRESNRIAQQRHRLKSKIHEADLKAQIAVAREEKEVAERKLLSLRQSREDTEQCIRHMIATWENFRVALQSSDLYQVANLCAKALSFPSYRGAQMDLPIPVVPERQIDGRPVIPARQLDWPISMAPVVPVAQMARDRQLVWPESVLPDRQMNWHISTVPVAPKRQMDWPIPRVPETPEISWSIPTTPEQLFGSSKYSY